MENIEEKLNEKFNELKILKEEKNKAWEKYRKKYEKEVKKYNEKLLEIFNFTDKYVKIEYEENAFHYIRVDSVFETDYFSDGAICIRGYGFSWEITEYSDMTGNTWDEMFSYYLPIGPNHNIPEELNKITVITAEEFDDEFHKMINSITERHLKNMEYYFKYDNAF